MFIYSFFCLAYADMWLLFVEYVKIRRTYFLIEEEEEEGGGGVGGYGLTGRVISRTLTL
jgi:hypothetical protein